MIEILDKEFGLIAVYENTGEGDYYHYKGSVYYGYVKDDGSILFGEIGGYDINLTNEPKDEDEVYGFMFRTNGTWDGRIYFHEYEIQTTNLNDIIKSYYKLLNILRKKILSVPSQYDYSYMDEGENWIEK
jgi:hypothetical protein